MDPLPPFKNRSFSQNVQSVQTKYKTAVQKLNKLQSNAATISKNKNVGPMCHVNERKKVDSTTKYLSRIGISLKDVDNLNIIHIAGTKGKGTTAALCESILRHHGHRTGFFSSPHLIAVRERIRINGEPLSELKFAEYFDEVYPTLENNKETEDDMPAYFKFLTVMAFHAFIRENIDVAIVEVGIGGEYDCTNCIRKPAVVGITTLGLDHTSILGNSLSEIAWQKAGVLKRGARAFTVSQSSPAAMEVLRDRAINRQCSLQIAPSLESYQFDPAALPFASMVEDVYASNASLALQLANAWLNSQSICAVPLEPVMEENDTVSVAPAFKISRKMAEGLASCAWPGRTQIIEKESTTYFLDGAHTEESIAYCLEWYIKASSALNTEMDGPRRILVFNVTGLRPYERFLEILSECNFDQVIFPAIIAVPNQTNSSDQFSLLEHKKGDEALQAISTTWNKLSGSQAQIYGTVSEAFNAIHTEKKSQPCHVLITGSVHLVGAALSLLDPDLTSPTIRVPATLRPLQSLYKGIQAVL